MIGVFVFYCWGGVGCWVCFCLRGSFGVFCFFGSWFYIYSFFWVVVGMESRFGLWFCGCVELFVV